MTPLAAMLVGFDAEAASESNLVAATMADPLRAMFRKSLREFITQTYLRDCWGKSAK
jgi:hypothetical protein